MPNLNKVMIMGNITRDIELKYTASGMAVASLGIATNRKFKDSKTGELREEVTFVDVEVWAKSAETIAQYCQKGSPIFIEGRLKQDSWQDKTSGKTVYKMKVVCEGFQFLSGKQGTQSGQAPRAAQPTQQRPQARPAAQKQQPVDDQGDFGNYGGDLDPDSVPF